MPSSFRSLFALALILSSAAAPSLHAEETLGWQALPGIFSADRLAKFDALKKLPAPPAESAFFHPGDDLRDLSEFLDEASPRAWFSYHQPEPPPPNAARWPGRWAVWNATTRTVVARGAWDDLLYAERELLQLNDYGYPGDSVALRLTAVLSHPGSDDRQTLSLLIPGEGSSTGSLDGMTLKASGFGFEREAEIDLTLSMREEGNLLEISTTPRLISHQPRKVVTGGKAHPWELTLEVHPVLPGSEEGASFRFIEKGGAIVPRTPGFPWLVMERLDEHRFLAITPSVGLMTCTTEPSNWWQAPLFDGVPPGLDGLIGPGLFDLRGRIDGMLRFPQGTFHAPPGFIAGYDPRALRYFFVADEATLDPSAPLARFMHGNFSIRVSGIGSYGNWSLLTRHQGSSSIALNGRALAFYTDSLENDTFFIHGETGMKSTADGDNEIKDPVEVQTKIRSGHRASLKLGEKFKLILSAAEEKDD